MDPLHIEIAALKTIGDCLRDPGWSSSLSEADITSLGAADSFSHVAHVKKTRSAYHEHINIFLKNLIFFEIPNMKMFEQLPSLIFSRFHLNFRSLHLLYISHKRGL